MGNSLDRIDHQIISLLQDDGRMPNLEIARQLGVTEGTIRKRLERLLSGGIIKVTAVPDVSQLGYKVETIIGIQAAPNRANEIGTALARMPEVVYVGYTTGAYDLVIRAVFGSNEELLSFLTSRVSVIQGVTRTETSHVLKSFKRAEDWRIPEAKMGTGKKILVVDDDRVYLGATKAILTGNGFQVVTALDGTEGLEKAKQEKPDLIVLDYMMATPTEGSLVSWLMKEDSALKGIPVLMVTAVGQKNPWWGVHPDEDELPVDGWLDKPVAPDVLVREINNLLLKKEVDRIVSG